MSTNRQGTRNTDQFPHADIANNEQGETPEHANGDRKSSTGGQKDQSNPTESRRTPGSAEGERDRDEQSR